MHAFLTDAAIKSHLLANFSVVSVVYIVVSVVCIVLLGFCLFGFVVFVVLSEPSDLQHRQVSSHSLMSLTSCLFTYCLEICWRQG